MAHVISDECVSCGACESECPVGAISMGADHMQIDATFVERFFFPSLLLMLQ